MDVVIAGGGSAGWSVAWAFARGSKVSSITVVESSRIGIIGVGEASSGLTTDLLTDFHTFSDSRIMNDKMPFDFGDFYSTVHATPKFALVHKNWSKIKNHSYVAPVEGSFSHMTVPDLGYLACVAKWGGRGAHLSSALGVAQALDKWPLGDNPGAIQFDAKEYSKYLKGFLTKDPRVKVIDADIEDAELDSRGYIKNIVLKDGSRIEGDFFVDCTGFKRVLGKKMDVGWNSYADVLPVDRAMPFIEEYKSFEKEIPVGTATGMDAGWMWQANLNHRRGMGYVYSSQFISDEDAVKEVEKLRGRKVDPVAFMKFDSGSVNDFWKKNCLVVGLAASFIEPLEATSLHATMMQAITFVREYLGPDVEKTINSGSMYFYNKQTKEMYEHYKDFVVFHYQGGRTDTPFWQHITNDKLSTPVVDSYIEKVQARAPGRYMFNDIWNVDVLWKWTATGLGFFTQKQARAELDFLDLKYIANREFHDFYDSIESELLKTDLKFQFAPKGRDLKK